MRVLIVGGTGVISTPITRILLERRVHRFISKDNDKKIKSAIEQGIKHQRTRRPPQPEPQSKQ